MKCQFCRTEQPAPTCPECQYQRRLGKTKECAYCHEPLPVRAFYLRTAASDGLQSYCKTCQLTVQKQYNRSVVEKIEYLYKESVYHLTECEFVWDWNVDLLNLTQKQQQVIAGMAQRRIGFDPREQSYVEFLRAKE